MAGADTLTRLLTARLEEGGGEPAARAIVQGVWNAVVEGAVNSGARLPTSRQLAVQLGVSPRSVERAYSELEQLGVKVDLSALEWSPSSEPRRRGGR
jgi:DNA-binding transcriptional MocR family regulator